MPPKRLRSATPPAPTPPPKRARGRPRNVQPVLSDDEPTVGRQTRVTRNNKRTQAISTDSSEDTSDNEKDRLTSNSEDESDVAADEQSPLEAAPPVRRRRGRPPRKPPVHVQDSESEDIEVPAATTDEPEQAKVSAGQEGTEDEEEEEEVEDA
ncbi:hypothetical protein GGI07_001027 [Coemansia sp. Benny D115]|nr:hypothetical protein GGI07_001027 [Coemansia sp. Benny D115]